MPRFTIPIEIKRQCCEMHKSGKTSREIYDSYFKMECGAAKQTFETFSRELNRWEKKTYPDQLTLDAGTYRGFTAHGATVQVSASGEIVQAWIKQNTDGFDPIDFIDAIKEAVTPCDCKPRILSYSMGMLEIPLFDMHWGISFMEDYEHVLDEILQVMLQQRWSQIVIPFGQDFFHNDSIANGQTTKGTQIEKVDMFRAVKEGYQFVCALIDSAINCADEVKILYSPGNHDRSMSWMLMQTLLERYGPDIVDDSLEFRKVITYGKNSIMVTHGDSRRATPSNLAHIFAITFAEEFARSNIREVHAGHLHCESDSDVFGVMVRRLSSGNKTDEWSDKEDFIGAHRRFMLFEWGLDKLRSIHYV